MTPERVDAAPVRLAATVMLLRETPHGVQTLLVRRHRAMAFLGGVWVFPGGKLERADRSAQAMSRMAMDARVRCEEWSARPWRPCSPEEAVGMYVAACRETFEEAGVLLARRSDGTACAAEQVERLWGERDCIARRPDAFIQMLEREDLNLDAGLIPWAHWVTPSLEPIRFDARFFAAAVPADQRVALDATESTDHVWMTPQDAVDAYQRREIVLAAPTLATLIEAADGLAEHGSLAGMLSAESTRAIAPVLPKLRRDRDGVVALMPWDAEYDAVPGEGSPPEFAFPDRLRKLPSRLPLPVVEARSVR